MKTVAVVGGGIAGLTIAERLQRFKNVEVTLFERANQLGTMATAQQHGWFHAGNLYGLSANHKTIETAKSNVAILAAHYGHLIAAAEANGKSWFKTDRIDYLFPARANDENSPLSRVESLNNFLTAASELAHVQWPKELRRDEPSAHHWLRIASTDRPMRTHEIMCSLLRSFLGFGGTLRLGQNCDRHGCEDGLHHLSVTNGRLNAGYDHIILATGNEVPTSGISGLETRYSPMMVIYPRLSKSNFVVAETGAEKSLSHIVHSIYGTRYSVVSGSYSRKRDDEAGLQDMIEELTLSIEKRFPGALPLRKKKYYFGLKTDVQDNALRRDYSPIIRELPNGAIYCAPGKFSFSFILAHRISEKLCDGSDLKEQTHDIMDVSQLVASPMHRQLALDLTRSPQ